MAKEIKAQAKNTDSSAQKARIVADAVRGMNALYALDVLKFMRKGAAHDVRKVVKSAIANAEHNESMNPEELVISQIFVDEGITYKRFRPESKGRVRRIMKRNSHITVIVSDKKDKSEGLKVSEEVKEAKSTTKTTTDKKPKAAKKETKKTKAKTAKPKASAKPKTKPKSKPKK